MLAKIEDHVPKFEPVPLPDYDGFPVWHMLRVTPQQEVKVAERLKVGNLLVYVPTYSKMIRRRGRLHGHRLYAAITGMVFMPAVFLGIARRRDLFEFARVHDFVRSGGGELARLTKSDIDLVRIMEAKLNLPPECKGVLFKAGQEVRFTDPLFEANWVGGKIFEIASEHRIGVEVDGLFGCKTRVYVPASEIEAL